MAKFFRASYIIASHDDYSHHTAGQSSVTHPCPLVAALLARRLADAEFNEYANSDPKGIAGGGPLILDDGHIDRIVDGEKDLATYWNYDRLLRVETMTRNVELVKRIQEREAKAL